MTVLCAVCLPFLFASCVSTNVYVKESAQFYENDVLKEETSSVKRDGKVLQKTETVYDVTTSDSMQVYSRIEAVNGGAGTMTIQLFDGDALYAEKELTVKSGSASAFGIGEKSEKINRAAKTVLDERAKKSADESTASQTRMIVTEDQIQVDSSPNGKYIAYTIFGKPFVMLGATSLSLLKCTGYALINFAGGYSTIVHGNFFWKMPDVKKSREKAAAAREANRITVFPEYHKPFTNNHITLTSTTTENANIMNQEENSVKVLARDVYEYDNTLSVERSAAADANSTAATIGLVGTIITVPVSVITWICGAAVGVYYELQD
ncbi:MAG: hypothetical protein K6G80_09570 [Treponema sp.]|nr:hypothetical protein [Treponema sp.]